MHRRAARAPRPDPLPAPSGARDPDGEVAEWSKAPHSKCGVRATVPWVRIPPSPPPGQPVVKVGCAAGIPPDGDGRARLRGPPLGSAFLNPDPIIMSNKIR